MKELSDFYSVRNKFVSNKYFGIGISCYRITWNKLETDKYRFVFEN